MDKIDFHKVYTACKDQVWKLASKYVPLKEDREDLFQEIFLSVHKALPRFRGEAAVNTWVYKIAVNTAINYLKKRKRYQWMTKILQTLHLGKEDPPDAGPDIQQFKPLEKLNPQQRMILLLADVEDQKLEEIAAIMRIPVGTVKSNLHRAREIIRKEVHNNERL